MCALVHLFGDEKPFDNVSNQNMHRSDFQVEAACMLLAEQWSYHLPKVPGQGFLWSCGLSDVPPVIWHSY